jgi:hypoxanthine phosphoribosyltransferase
MAERLAERIDSPVSGKLKVVRRTRDHVELSADVRRPNVAGACAPKGPIAGRILLVDGIFTTGTTLSECAGVLRKAGAREVHALAPVQNSLAVSNQYQINRETVDSERGSDRTLRERANDSRTHNGGTTRKADSLWLIAADRKEAKCR